MPFNIGQALRDMERGTFDPVVEAPIILPKSVPMEQSHPQDETSVDTGSAIPEDLSRVIDQPQELVVVPRTGRARQAGADTDGEWLARFKTLAERSLYFFAKTVLGKWWLIPELHKDVCAFLQNFDNKRRKMLLLPREHGKTSLVCDSLPIHLLIQPKATNVYMANIDGADTRIIMCCESLDMAKPHIRVLETTLENNELLRALWPHRVWQGRAQRESRVWNSEELIIPRDNEFPDPSIKGLGIGGAVHGRHPNVLIKDDLVTLNAANSDSEMQTAIQWHRASRNVFDGQPKHLEFVIGTRWAYHDLYQDVIDNDLTVECVTRRAIENGKIIYPIVGQRDDGTEIGFTMEKLEAKRKDNPVLFALNYMNDASDPALIDFPEQDLRLFKLFQGTITFEEDERDQQLRRWMTTLPAKSKQARNPFQGMPLTPEIQIALFESLRRGQ